MAEAKESTGAFLRRLAESPAAAANVEVLEKIQAKFQQQEADKLEARLTRVKAAMDVKVTELAKWRREAAKTKGHIDALEKLANNLVAGEETLSDGFEMAFDKARFG